MIRTLGFVVGSLLSLAALVILVGMPRFAADEGVPVEAVRKPQPPAVDAPQGPAAETPSPRIPDSVPDASPGDPEEPTAVAEAIAVDAVAAAVAEVEPPRSPAEREWRTFWTPFRSRVAAEGFIGRLESLTGLDYRVAKEGIDRYHVQFAYRDEAELDSNLATISAATGLELADRPP